jgi:vacuolar-type H+-ATPase subunit C/Vma6
MSPSWEDLNSRVSGLSSRLLRRSQLEMLSQARDLAGLAVGLENTGLLPPGFAERSSPGAIDLAVRRVSADRMRLLAQWSRERTDSLAVIFEDEDRRSLRAIFRGVNQGAPSEARMAGLIPTPSLPEKALEELAHQPTAAEVVTLLVIWKNPYGAPLRKEAQQAQPDLFKLELILNRTFAQRASHAAREAGQILEDYVSLVIDLENASAALVLAEQGQDVHPAQCFISGGRRLSYMTFRNTVYAGGAAQAGAVLGLAFTGTPFAEAFRSLGADPVRLEEELTALQVKDAQRIARREPLGPGSAVAYALRLRAESVDLRRIIWGVALDAPREQLFTDLIAAS